MTLPHNIEPRLHSASHRPACCYRGYDRSDRVWFIGGKSGAWSATCRDDPRPALFAPTLSRLGEKLEKIA